MIAAIFISMLALHNFMFDVMNTLKTVAICSFNSIYAHSKTLFCKP